MAHVHDILPPKAPSKDGFEPPEWFWQSRRKGSSTTSTLVWTTLNLLNVSFQYWLLKSSAGINIVQRFGAIAVQEPRHAETPLGLSPYSSVVFGMALGGALKTVYWKAFINDTVMPIPILIALAIYHAFLNGLNTLLALWSVTSQQPADQSDWKAFLTSCPLVIPIGITLYCVGLFTEWYCEVQRTRFKKDPRNKGKPYSGGLFGLARNINYGGHVLWRSGYSLVCGSWIWSAIICGWMARDFVGRAIPSMDAYCEQRYGVQWEQVRRRVPYKLLPWIY